MKRLFSPAQAAVTFLLVLPFAARSEPYDTRTIVGITGLAGTDDGTNFNAGFTGPAGLAADQQGILYLADGFRVRKITPSGTNWVVTTLAGDSNSLGEADGLGTQARFNYVQGLAIDTQGNLFAADTYNHTVRKITPAGYVTTLAGLAGVGNAGTNDGTNSSARFDRPHGIAVRADAMLFVADTYNNAIRQVKPVGTNWVVTTIAGLAGRTNAGTNNGVGSVARFNWPLAITIDSLNQMYVADCNNHSIRKLTLVGANWTVTTFAGLPGTSGVQDGVGVAARFNRPDGVVADPYGNVFVADGDNHTIRKITPAGQVSTLAGSPALPGAVDGVGSVARFNAPYGLALDQRGTLFISDNLNFIVRQAKSIYRLEATQAGNQIVVSWPVAAAGTVLQTRTSLTGGTAWTPQATGIVTLGNRYVYTNTASGGSRFFRLGPP